MSTCSCAPSITATPPRSTSCLRACGFRRRKRTYHHSTSAKRSAEKSKQKARPKRDKRHAKVSLRYRQVKIEPPRDFKGNDPISLWVIHVSEKNPPADTKPLEWFLITTIDIKSVEDAINCVEWYIKRWRIEDWHRVLKSGCKTEDLAHKTADRLRRAIAINLVVAWRIMLMTLLGREAPELPPEILFSDLEIKVLKAYAKKRTAGA